jgi:hypothetical protein
MPSGNGSVTARCCVCDKPLPPGRPRVTCSDACRQALWRRRHQPEITPPQPPARRARKAATVYECDDCGARALGGQFCEECRRFMRRVGHGGISPCCGEPVTFDELLES